MNIKEDYMRFKEGGLHLEREQTRVNTFVSRLNAQSEFKGVPRHVFHAINETRTKAKGLLNILCAKTDEIGTDAVKTKYLDIEDQIKSLSQTLGIITPKHRPIDIQTSDAGPGVWNK